MPAKRSTSRAGERRATQEAEVDPSQVDMTEVPMTPAMMALHEVAQLKYEVRQIEAYLNECVLDGTQLTLAEGQLYQHVIAAQGRPFTWRAQLKKAMEKRRRIDISARDWRQRAAGTVGMGKQQKVPTYLSVEVLGQLRARLAPVIAAIEAAEAQRNEEFPALNRRTKAALRAPAAQAKAS